MQRARRKQFNALNAASLARWIVVTAFLAVSGLIYVYLNVQLYQLGEQKKKLEVELTNIRSEIDVTNVQIAALTSRKALERRLHEGYLKMIPIAEQHIVRINPPTTRGEDAIQPVSNPRAGR